MDAKSPFNHSRSRSKALHPVYIPLPEPENGPSFHRQRLNSEIIRLKEMAQKWDDMRGSMPDLPEWVTDEINCLVSGIRLLINSKFEQFRGLVENCARQYRVISRIPVLSPAKSPRASPSVPTNPKRIVKPEDLDGFWEMMYTQVASLEKKMLDLELAQSNGWEQQPFCETLILPTHFQMPRRRMVKPQGRSKFREFLKRNTAATQSTQNAAVLLTASENEAPPRVRYTPSVEEQFNLSSENVTPRDPVLPPTTPFENSAVVTRKRQVADPLINGNTTPKAGLSVDIASDADVSSMLPSATFEETEILQTDVSKSWETLEKRSAFENPKGSVNKQRKTIMGSLPSPGSMLQELRAPSIFSPNYVCPVSSTNIDTGAANAKSSGRLIAPNFWNGEHLLTSSNSTAPNPRRVSLVTPVAEKNRLAAQRSRRSSIGIILSQSIYGRTVHESRLEDVEMMDSLSESW